MLKITVPATELWDEGSETFINIKKQTLQLEHSLVSISKWEAKWHKPFLSKEEKTSEETIDYIRCMTITQNVPPETYYGLTNENIKQVQAYIEDPMTATWFSEEPGGKSKGEVVTNELIYYWMVALGIPMDREKWHLNHLLTLIKVCNIKNQPPKKRGRQQTAKDYAALNKARRNRYNSRG
jgi:hypothetical protein